MEVALNFSQNINPTHFEEILNDALLMTVHKQKRSTAHAMGGMTKQ